MRLEFLDRQDGFRGSGGSARVRTDTGLFWWTILITVLTGLASFCWFFSIYVFAHPEKPLNYQLLKKLGKLQEVKDFSPLDVPNGTIHPAKELYASFYQLSSSHLGVKNAILKRNFISNYKNNAPLYLSGRFEVLTCRILGDEDLITSGCVVRARSVDYPNVDVEYLVPAEAVEVIPYAEGDTFKISGSGHYASVIHVDRYAEDKLCFTAIPLIYPELAKALQAENEPVKLVMAAPRSLNMKAELPLTEPPKSVVGEVARLLR
jgi:hypothetical protein